MQLLLLLLAVGTLVGGSLLAAKDFAAQLREAQHARQESQDTVLTTRRAEADADAMNTANGFIPRNDSSGSNCLEDSAESPDFAQPHNVDPARYGHGQQVSCCPCRCFSFS